MQQTGLDDILDGGSTSTQTDDGGGSGMPAPNGSGSGDESVIAYVTNVEYTEEGGKPILHLFGRDEDGQKWHVETTGHRPSFFVKEKEFGPAVTNHYAVYSHSKLDSENEPYEDIDGNELVRVYTYLPGQVAELREQFNVSYEADVFYTNRWLIDNEIYTGIEVDISEELDRTDNMHNIKVAVDDIQPT